MTPFRKPESNPARESHVALSERRESLTTELLILPDGQVLVHNLTQPFAELLAELNPACEQITSSLSPHASRPAPRTSLSHELSD